MHCWGWVCCLFEHRCINALSRWECFSLKKSILGFWTSNIYSHASRSHIKQTFNVFSKVVKSAALSALPLYQYNSLRLAATISVPLCFKLSVFNSYFTKAGYVINLFWITITQQGNISLCLQTNILGSGSWSRSWNNETTTWWEKQKINSFGGGDDDDDNGWFLQMLAMQCIVVMSFTFDRLSPWRFFWPNKYIHLK